MAGSEYSWRHQEAVHDSSHVYRILPRKRTLATECALPHDHSKEFQLTHIQVIGPLLYDPGQAPLYATGLGSSFLMFATVLGTSV